MLGLHKWLQSAHLNDTVQWATRCSSRRTAQVLSGLILAVSILAAESSLGCANVGSAMANVVRQSLPSTAKVIVDSRKRNALRKIPGSSSIAGLRKGLTGRTKRQVLYDFSTCAVVGNGGAMKSREFGHAIESHKVATRRAPAVMGLYHAIIFGAPLASTFILPLGLSGLIGDMYFFRQCFD
mmetsp:Transcript_23152/g.64319  ORF Transcript_23152/g.64319 Transcript_23152/m.64319 type:complete len:182 (+) Transcript_23152:253-798(+)